MHDFRAIEELDLEPIKVKLMHEASGEGWRRERADAVERQYRRFLVLMKKYPGEAAAPLRDVDTFWHYHILDTVKYAADCEAVFGYFLHHFPYIGLRGEQDLAAHRRLGERMRELYEETFGEDYPGVDTGARATARRAARSASQTAWSARVAGTAWSASPGGAGVAWSAVSGTAWSAGPARPASSVTAVSVPAGKVADPLFTARPRLPPPAP